MDQHLLKIIEETAAYIEDRLLEPLDLERIARSVNVSKFYLLRIWKSATNTGLMEYVRKRRIALSLRDLIHEQNSIEFISSRYGFGSERTYNRVFKEEYNITPAKWRRHPVALQILDRLNTDFLSCAGEGLVFFRGITILPAFTVAGHEYLIDIEDNQKNQTANKYGVAFFYNNRSRIINPVDPNVYYGFTTVFDPAGSATLYQPSFEVDPNSIIPPDMKVKYVSPHKYGVFTYMGPHAPEKISSETLKNIWAYVFQTWMPTVQRDLEEIFHFEYIDYAKCNKQYCQCDLYYPICAI